jgi:hypothetical protein
MVTIEKDRRFFILILVYFYSTIIISQERTNSEPCDGNLFYEGSEIKDCIGLNYYDCIRKYIEESNPKTLKDLNFSAKNLYPINSLYNSPSINIFMNKSKCCKNISFEFYFSQHGIIFTYYDSILLDFGISPVLALEDSLNSKVFGNLPYDSRVKYELLDSIVMFQGNKRISLNLNLLKAKIINVNRVYKSNSLRPIEIYFNKRTNKYYIYLYFLSWNFNDEFKPNNSIISNGFSDIIKLIVDPNSGNINFINVPIKILTYYGWFDCPNFWPF